MPPERQICAPRVAHWSSWRGRDGACVSGPPEVVIDDTMISKDSGWPHLVQLIAEREGHRLRKWSRPGEISTKCRGQLRRVIQFLNHICLAI